MAPPDIGLRFFVFSLLVSTVFTAGEEELTFGYDKSKSNGPQHWGDMRPEWEVCKNGQEQSPINIHTHKAIIDPHLCKLDTNYKPSHSVLFHDGHALEVAVVTPGDAGYLNLNGERYNLSQFHFHSPSEHAINGHRGPMDMHMVHVSDSGKIAVIGIIFKFGLANPFLDEFWDKLPLVTGVNVEVDISQLVVDTPHLRMGPSYARYGGSLTTPPCSQEVTWTIALGELNTMSVGQYAALKKLLPDDNARPLQKLHGRDVRVFKA